MELLKQYLKNLQTTLNKGDAREESYYTHFKDLLLSFAEQSNIKKIDITILPKQTEAGNPDFRVWDGNNHVTGYIEAKAPSVTNLDSIEESEQLKRYRATFPNVILTNFYEFRLYREGELIDKVTIARPVIAQKLRTAPPVENENDFFELLSKFFSFSLPSLQSAKSLALELAKRTRFLRDEVISIELAQEFVSGKKAILGFFEAFKTYLLGTLTEKQFADLYAQTITYGLFAARSRAGEEFNRELAFKFIPNTIGILRDIFQFISLGDSPKSLQMIVDDISAVLKVTDVKSILRDYFREGKGRDPIIHFYETFLAAYDPTIREKRGVYYTPEPVVNYIVKSLHLLLKTHFDLPDGLASEDVTLLDPAAGTLTFPAEAIKSAVTEFTEKYGEGGKRNFIKKQILPNFFAFELMMAPYAIGHLKMSFLLEELGYQLADDERFNLYLTNTLELEELEQISIPGLSSLSDESHFAANIKKEQSILVILGNPPYSGISANISEWTERLLKEDVDGMQSYYKIDGKPLGEKKLWLQDDYVKFLRFAQWKIEQAGFGIVGMITNHSYLDNPTFRGMRQSLMKTFTEIYIINLHGNSLKKETAPDGSKDENVFEIRQGVAIAIFLKQKDKKGCKVYHKDLYGLRKIKYDWLFENDFVKKNYTKIKPQSPWYFFIARDTENIQDYLNWKKINEIFPQNNVGIVTARDSFVIDFDLMPLKSRILQFRNLSFNEKLLIETYKLKDTSTFNLKKSREELSKDVNWENYYQKILYRPFDIRHIFYNEWLVERPIYQTMRHMLDRENLAITIGRQGHVVGASALWNLAYISDKMVDFNLYYRGGAVLFPLYLYTEKEEQNPRRGGNFMMVFDTQSPFYVRSPNIEPKIYEKVEKTFSKKLSPEDILCYCYGILYSNTYRTRYAEFLKIDFPRVPFTGNHQLFKKVAAFGKQLADLHLLKSNTLNKPISKYCGSNDSDRIERIKYFEKENRVYINDNKYFDGITLELWNYHIGGYQVLHKFLKDRQGRVMDDPRYYTRIVTAISKTIELQKKLDNIYDQIEKEIIQF